MPKRYNKTVIVEDLADGVARIHRSSADDSTIIRGVMHRFNLKHQTNYGIHRVSDAYFETVDSPSLSAGGASHWQITDLRGYLVCLVSILPNRKKRCRKPLMP